MDFIDKSTISEYTGMVFKAPTLENLDDFSKENLQEIFKQVYSDFYINKTENLRNFLQFNITEKISEQILRDYGIDKNYVKNLNPLFKKSITFFIEKLFQTKGSLSVLQIFNKVFESLFSCINFYKIIIVKDIVTKMNDDGTKTASYVLDYALEPLYINDSSKMVQTFDKTISLTGKFAMDLEQFKDYKIFPITTNYIYAQFTSTEINLNNMETFGTGVRAYSLTVLKDKKFSLRNFYDEYFVIDGSDLPFIIFYLEMYKNRLINPNYDFDIDKDKVFLSLMMGKENLYELEKFLNEYKHLKFHDRKMMNDFKRRWHAFTKYFLTTEKIYKNFSELEEYLKDSYPELMNIRTKYLKTETDFLNFYIDLYLYIIQNIDTSDEYLFLYVNSLFLSVITGQKFIDNFFLPVYKIFQKYFFPIEMDFLAEIIQSFIIRDKFEGISYDDSFVSMDFDVKAMTKRYTKVDKIKIYFLKFFKDKFISKDKINLNVNIFQNEKQILKTYYNLFIYIDKQDKLKYFNENNISVYILEKNKVNLSRFITIDINIDNDDKLSYDHYIHHLIMSFNNSLINQNNTNNLIKQKINDNANTSVNSNKIDDHSKNDKFSSKIDRYQYTQVYDKLSYYLTFLNLENGTKASNITNQVFKNTKMDDQIYFDIHKLF